MTDRVRRMHVVGAVAALVATMAFASAESAPNPGVFVAPPDPYGWSGSVAPDSTVTDGSTILEITHGPVRIVSVTLKQSGATADIVGINIRTLHPRTMSTYLMTPGFPAQTPADWAGAELAAGATLAGPTSGQVHADYEILIGYRFPATGLTHRDSVIITYDYAGSRYTLTHPSQADICVRADYDPAHPQTCEPSIPSPPA